MDMRLEIKTEGLERDETFDKKLEAEHGSVEEAQSAMKLK